MAKVAESVCTTHCNAKTSEPPGHEFHISSFQDDYKRILFVTSELADLVKVGGLGDVSAALPRALRNQHDIRILIPGYREVLTAGHKVKLVGKIAGCASIPSARLGRIDLDDGLIVYVIICPQLYEREGTPYGSFGGEDWPDNPLRFALLGHAAAEIAARQASISWQPQLVHANDWPAGLAPAYMAWRGITTPTLFTIHNLMHHGVIDAATLPALGAAEAAATCHSLISAGQTSFMKAGIMYASFITTVSATYAREITQPDHGCGLDELLKSKARDGLLMGILNGIDESWDPLTDPHLLRGFRCWEHGGKALHARYVEDNFGLDRDDGPLFAVVSRLVYQKGIDLTLQATDEIVSAGGRLIVMGQGEARLQTAMKDLETRYPGRVSVQVGFREYEARRIYAASDFLLMPSRFEPCGLSQLYAQRLGSLPIARRTGGLADTIQDGINGFLFDEISLPEYLQAIRRALRVHQRRELLSAMRRHAVISPAYWRQSVKPYDQLYKSLIKSVSPMSIAC